MVVMTGGAPGIERVGPGMLLDTPQCPGRPAGSDLALMSAVPRGDPDL